MFEANNKIFAVGGYDTENSFKSIDLMNAKEWRKEKDLPFNVASHCITRYNESHFLLTGGWNKRVSLEKFEFKMQIKSFFLIENIDCLVFQKITFLINNHLFSVTGHEEDQIV